MIPPVIITRAQPGADETARRLTALGADAVLSPCLTLAANPQAPLPAPDSLGGLIFTSANGVRFYAARTGERHLPVWCVGPATADAARAAGFQDVHASAGDANALAAHILTHSAATTKPLLHVANAAATGILKQALDAAQRPVLFAPLYHAVPAPGLSAQAAALLQSQFPACVFVHSAKGAAAFAALSASLPVRHLASVAISHAAAQPLLAVGLQDPQIADTPNEDGMFNAYKTVCATLSA